jgi:hypothetical protein
MRRRCVRLWPQFRRAPRSWWCRSDPEAGKRAGVGIGLEPADFYAMGEMIAGACPKVLIVQEGGYDLDGVGKAAKALVAGLVGR